MTDNFSAFAPSKYNCEKCNFICSKKNEWERHIITLKHKNSVSHLQKAPTEYKCSYCDKVYKHRQSLFTHCKRCHNLEGNTEIINDSKKEIPMGSMVTNEMFMKLLEQNTELQKQIIELSKHSGTVNNNNNNNNITNNNNQFNLNLFLNETCKDALNIDDFMDSIKLSVSDLEETGRLGFVEGITRIFLQGLRNLDITQRPFHCTDVKRETVYVKDQNKWEKETAEKTKMKQALNQAVRKNLGMITLWREVHPDYLRSNTKDNDDYIKISLNSLGSEYDDEQKRMDEKIIRNVLKEIVLDKKNCIE
jgi:hypothetical protein